MTRFVIEKVRVQPIYTYRSILTDKIVTKEHAERYPEFTKREILAYRKTALIKQAAVYSQTTNLAPEIVSFEAVFGYTVMSKALKPDITSVVHHVNDYILFRKIFNLKKKKRPVLTRRR